MLPGSMRSVVIPTLEGASIVGSDTFKNDDASIASQITRIKELAEEPDVIMLCSVMPGAAAAVRQILGAGTKIAVGGVRLRFGRTKTLVRECGERGFGMHSCGRTCQGQPMRCHPLEKRESKR